MVHEEGFKTEGYQLRKFPIVILLISFSHGTFLSVFESHISHRNNKPCLSYKYVYISVLVYFHVWNIPHLIARSLRISDHISIWYLKEISISSIYYNYDYQTYSELEMPITKVFSSHLLLSISYLLASKACLHCSKRNWKYGNSDYCTWKHILTSFLLNVIW